MARARAEDASMRPGQSCPGVGGGIGIVGEDGPGFNEAGAIMPRSGWGYLAPRGLGVPRLQ